MLDRVAARKIAGEFLEARADKRIELSEDGVRELREGWYFPYRSSEIRLAGSHGVIINKATGKLFELGSAYPVESDLDFYDKGYQFNSCDLVITSVANVEHTVETLQKLGISTVDLKYEHGEVWRIPRPLTRAELATSLSMLPHVFGDVGLYFRYEILEEARKSRAFGFVILEHRNHP